MPAHNRYERETFWNVLSYIEERVDPQNRTAQIPAVQFAHDVGISERTLYRYLTDMEDFHIISRRRVATHFVAGSQPNVYTLHVRVADLRERWDEIVHGGGLPAPANDPAMPASVLPTPEPVREAVAADVLEVIEALELGDEDIEVDGWLAGT